MRTALKRTLAELQGPIDAEKMALLYDMLADAREAVTRIETLLAGSSGEPHAHPIVLWRQRRNMSQRELADAVGITSPALWRIEHSPGLCGRKETREKISTVLGVPEAWLVAGDTFIA